MHQQVLNVSLLGIVRTGQYFLPSAETRNTQRRLSNSFRVSAWDIAVVFSSTAVATHSDPTA